MKLVSISVYRYMRLRASRDPKFKAALAHVEPSLNFHDDPGEGEGSLGPNTPYDGHTYNLGSGCRWVSCFRYYD
jgi:hypothetical protein